MERMMLLNEKQELTDMICPGILPLEHSGGEGWTILHGDTLQLVRAFQSECFDALVTDPPYASGGRPVAAANTHPGLRKNAA